MIILQILAIFAVLYWIPMLVVHSRGLPKIPRLSTVQTPLTDEPLVSVIVAGKEEEDTIEATLQSLLAQEYRQLELIVLNDRSEDRTGERMEAVQKRFASAAASSGVVRFEVVQIQELPSGWLGKNHALYQGYLRARGDLLLFTDADVQFQPYAIRTAIQYFQALELDHLTLTPFMYAKTFWLQAFVQFFLYALCLLKWPWKPNDDRQHKEGFGIGAFNLLSRHAYEKVGTHRAIALRPDDDLMLGTKVKQARLKQRFVLGAKLLQVEWYPTLRAAMRGLEKNLFAGLQYSLWMTVVAVLGQVALFFLPFLGLFYSGWVGYLFLLAALCNIALYVLYTRRMASYTGLEVIALPLTVLLFLFILLRSTYLTLRQGGIYWRGTFYSLQELKHPPK